MTLTRLLEIQFSKGKIQSRVMMYILLCALILGCNLKNFNWYHNKTIHNWYIVIRYFLSLYINVHINLLRRENLMYISNQDTMLCWRVQVFVGITKVINTNYWSIYLVITWHGNEYICISLMNLDNKTKY